MLLFFTTGVSEIDAQDLKRWLKKSRDIQWDYKKYSKKEKEN
jgi:hypothetical protein